MNFLSGRDNREAEQKTTVAEDDCLKEDVLIEALEAFQSNETLPDLGHLPQRLRTALERLSAELQTCNDEALRKTVDYSIQSSEAMAAIAQIAGHVRKTDKWAQTMAASVEELTTSVSQISEVAQRTANSMDSANASMHAGEGATREAAESSQRIGDSFESMLVAAAELSEAAEQIGTFVGTIEGLAKQTNLLALNATIEAARAGEAGKGFAVVASEVKGLSSETQKATDDIRSRIETLQTHVVEVNANVSEARGLVDSSIDRSRNAEQLISTVLSDVADSSNQIQEIANLLQQQDVATREISEGVNSIAEHAHGANDCIENVVTVVGGTERIIEEQFVEFEQRNMPCLILHRAKSDHLIWKKRLAEMMAGLNSLTSAELSDHHQCRLGKWYDNVKDPELLNHPAFKALDSVHEDVHIHGRECAKHFEKGETEAAMNAYDRVDEASKKVLYYLDRLIER